jgi:hypothetical protein
MGTGAGSVAVRPAVKSRVIAVALVLLVAAAGCSGESAHVERQLGSNPQGPQLSPLQQLDQALAQAGMRGVVEGVVASNGKVRALSTERSFNGATFPDQIVTEYRFRVTGTIGAPEPLYARGRTITLRTGGGELDLAGGGHATTSETVPPVHEGDELMVFVQDLPKTSPAGASSSRVLAVASDGNLARITASTRAVKWGDGTIPIETFRKHLRDHPVSTSATLLKLRIDLPHRRLVAGTSASGAVVVTNRTGAPIQLRTAMGCKPKFAVVVGNSKVHQQVAFAAVCELAPLVIRAGTTRLPFELPLTYLACVGGESSDATIPRCLVGEHRLPPLPAGRYRATFQDLDTGLPVPAAVPIRVVAATSRRG